LAALAPPGGTGSACWHWLRLAVQNRSLTRAAQQALQLQGQPRRLQRFVLLLEPISGTGGYFDEIIDYNGKDYIVAPFFVESDLLMAAIGTATSIAPNDIAALLTTSALAANAAAAFTVSSQTGSFIAMNDDRPGFQAATDLVVFLRNYLISATNPVDIV
jgi:hypothetical protein